MFIHLILPFNKKPKHYTKIKSSFSKIGIAYLWKSNTIQLQCQFHLLFCLPAVTRGIKTIASNHILR